MYYTIADISDFYFEYLWIIFLFHLERQVEEAPGVTSITAANGRAERLEVGAADSDAEGARERQSTSTIGSARELFRRLSVKPENIESAHKLTRNLDLYEPAHDDARALVQLKKRRFWLYLLEKVAVSSFIRGKWCKWRSWFEIKDGASLISNQRFAFQHTTYMRTIDLLILSESELRSTQFEEH